MQSLRGASEEQGPLVFDAARSLRQKTRAAGLHPDYWYAVEDARRIRRRGVVEVRFWNRSIAVFRGEDGMLRALENRCAHRHIKLTLGNVENCKLACIYHGWTYDGDGQLVDIPHDLFERKLVGVKIRSYPVRERYGLVWIFPGNAELAETTPLPHIPELEGPNRWAYLPVDRTWRAHHSMILENITDFTHAYLHRRYRPFVGAKVTRCEPIANTIEIDYEVVLGDARIVRQLLDPKAARVDRMQMKVDYPYQRSNKGGKIKHWCFMAPIDRQHTRVFFLFYFDALRIPLTPFRLPRMLMMPLLKTISWFLVKPIMNEDGLAVEAEQEAFDAFPGEAAIEFNPIVMQCQKLIVRRWEEYLETVQPQSGRGEAKGVA